MLRLSKTLQLSPFAELYDILLPKDNLYRRLADEIDYSFIYKALMHLYNAQRGRFGVDPDKMVKMLMLKAMTDLSDRDLMAEITYNMAYKYFLGMMPEDMPIESSTLSRFRTQRLKDNGELLQDLLATTISIAVERGIIKRDSNGDIKVKISYDSTHTVVIGAITRPMEGARYYIDRLYRYLEAVHQGCTADLPVVPRRFASAVEAIELLMEVCDRVRKAGLVTDMAISRLMNRIEEAIDDYRNIGSYCCADRDSRIGHKSVDSEFNGYKSHIGTDVDSGIIVSAEVTTGEASDTTIGRKMMTGDMEREDIKVVQMLGDAAYAPTDIIEKTEKNHIELIAPPNHNLGSSNIERDGFTFNKDANMAVCPSGHIAISRRRVHYKNENNRAVDLYYFDIEKCRICPLREKCLKKQDAKTKSYSVSINTEQQKQYLEKTQTEDFRIKYRKRTISERTNSVLKKSFGLKYTYGRSQQVMTVQSMVAIIAYNLRLIINKTACK